MYKQKDVSYRQLDGRPLLVSRGLSDKNPRIETSDLSRFNFEELYHAIRLIKGYADQGADWLGTNVSVVANVLNHNVFLVDRHFNVAMFDQHGSLRQWHCCKNPDCRSDGFDGEWYEANGKRTQLAFVKYDGYCSAACRKTVEETG